MAQVKHNIVTEGFSGKLDRIVFRQLGNLTVVSRCPQFKSFSDRQVAHRKRFKSAVTYARLQMLDPVAKAEYQARAKQRVLTSAFGMAVSDWLTPPGIDHIDAGNYSGNIGDTIIVTPKDSAKVTVMEIQIANGDGILQEAGRAVRASGGAVFEYTATHANPTVAGTTVNVIATDRPGNRVMATEVLV